jgi:hypothetical protein
VRLRADPFPPQPPRAGQIIRPAVSGGQPPRPMRTKSPSSFIGSAKARTRGHSPVSTPGHR